MSFSSFCYVILFMPDSLLIYSQNGKHQTVRLIMEGLLKMNGTGDTRLFFRFKGETQQQYNNAIYNIRPQSRLSTNFETGSNGNLLSSNTSEAETDITEEIVK